MSPSPGTSTVTSVTMSRVTTAVVLSQRAPTENYRHGHSAHATPGRPSPSLVHHLHDQASCAIVHGSNDECCIMIPVSADVLCPRYQTELVSAGQQPPHTCSGGEAWCLAPAPSYLQGESRPQQHSASTQQTYHHIVISSYHQSPGDAAAVGNTANNPSLATLPAKECAV